MVDPEYPDALSTGHARGRGAQLNPANRFESLRLHVLGDHLDDLPAERAAAGEDASRGCQVATQVFADHTRGLINKVDPNKSPDIPFKWTINPYRGCSHGCVYCYARPFHEYLGLSSGLDFETKIFAKHDAPKLLRKELAAQSWQGEPIVMAGVTDCYQPIERKLCITRGCLQVMAECHQPVSLVTKNHLITRDIDVLGDLAQHRAASAAISITTLDARLAGSMEPRASAPADRLRAIEKLANAGIPAAVIVAPVIPALTDREIPAILKAAADAGATSAGYVLLRLPHQVKAIFLDWLGRVAPDRTAHVTSLLQQSRGGKLYAAAGNGRMCGTGQMAEQIGAMFKLHKRKYGLDQRTGGLSSQHFRRPPGPQMTLF